MTTFIDYVKSEFSMKYEWTDLDDMDDAFDDFIEELTPDQIADYFDEFAKKYPRVVVAKSLYILLEQE